MIPSRKSDFTNKKEAPDTELVVPIRRPSRRTKTNLFARLFDHSLRVLLLGKAIILFPGRDHVRLACSVHGSSASSATGRRWWYILTFFKSTNHLGRRSVLAVRRSWRHRSARQHGGEQQHEKQR